MQAKVRVNYGGKVWLEVDVSSPKEALRAISSYAEVLAELTCGQCASPEITHEHREHGGHDYYALKCRACGAQLDFGQHKSGQTLFAKRKLPDGKYDSAHRGWYRWHERNPREDNKSEF